MGAIWGITFTGDTAFEGRIKQLLGQIASYWPGQTLLKAIDDVKTKHLTIQPYTEEDISPTHPLDGLCGAKAVPEVKEAAHPRGIPYYEDATESTTLGTGEGSNVTVSFAPNPWDGNSCGDFPGALADEVLLHEMFHALRQMEGRDNPYPMTGDVKVYTNEEEFLAIHFTNTYMSAKAWPTRKVALRGGHSTQVLDEKYSTSKGFLQNTEFRRVLVLQSYEALFKRMVGGKAEFNPFGELMANFTQYNVFPLPGQRP